MSNTLRFMGGLALVAALAIASAAIASEKIATATGKSCTACHDKPGSKLLTDAGKYYESQQTLDGYDAITGSFGKCTTCHVRKPGSAKLTKKGQQVAELAKDMESLRQWLKEGHPAPPAK
jgi:nitrate/TMAO reductase-like tetraheme cytochrome c subunit